MKPFWDSDDELTDLLFESNMSQKEIASQLGVSEQFLKSRIDSLGLSWVRRYKGGLSRGQAALTFLMRKVLPGENLRTEEPIGSRLFLDIYCPSYKLAIEYHGKQHFQYVAHFHNDMEGFRESQKRDERKEQACKDLGIALVVFRYNDDLSFDAVINRLIDTILQMPQIIPKEKYSIKNNEFYQSIKQRNNEFKRQQYAKMKNARKSRT